MTDLHTHILPHIDDGARSVAEAIALLRAEMADGVHTVALTPHFCPDITGQTEFREKRASAFALLNAAAREQSLPLRLILGAEIAYTPALLQLDLAPLCYEGSKTLLIELPLNHYPPFVRNVFFKLLLKGYTPLIAHAERYPYFAREPALLEELIRGGAFAQVNAGSLAGGGKQRKLALKMLKDETAHVLATDAHSPDKRPPKLKEAARIAARKLGKETAKKLVNYRLS